MSFVLFTFTYTFIFFFFLQQSFWKGDSDNEGSLSSLQSLEAGAEVLTDNRFFTLQKRESSMDRSVTSSN